MLTLIDEIALALAELQAQEPMDVARFEKMKMQPNASVFDADYDDDDFRWGE